MKISSIFTTLCTIALVWTSPTLVPTSSPLAAHASPSCHNSAVPRNLIYVDQTVGDDGPNFQNLSLLPLIQNPTNITHVILFKLDFQNDSTVTYQGAPISTPSNATKQQFADAKMLQSNGVKIMMTLGGAESDAFNYLAQNFTGFYPGLLNAIKNHSIDGLDLDIEEPTEQQPTLQLIQSLYQDLGSDFIITMAPVSITLIDNTPVPESGNLNYTALDQAAIASDKPNGKLIDWYNVQFYGGGTLDQPVAQTYEQIIEAGWQPNRTVMTLATFGQGQTGAWYPIEAYQSNISALLGKYPNFGGVAGWEYFFAGNNDPSIGLKHWKWTADIGDTLFNGTKSVSA